MRFTAVQMIGTQRSGSNLLRLMMNQLEAVSAPHPPHILERFMPLLPVYGDLVIAENFEKLVDDVCRLVEYNPVPWSNTLLDRAKITGQCKSPSLTEIARIIYEIKAYGEGARVWMCKSMANIHYTGQLEENIKPLYLHLYRDGRDVACSFRKAIVGEKHIYQLAKQWKEEQDLSLQLMQQLGTERVIQVKYEHLLAKPEEQMQRICSFIGVKYNTSVMDYYTSTEAKNTAKSGAMWQNVQQPVITTNYNKYRKELSEEDITLFEEVAGDTLEALGYTLDFSNNSQRSFTEDEIENYSILNKQMKQHAKQMQKPEDIEKRKKQDALLNSIKERMLVKTA